jgi:3-oxoacyl-[acyl-carrier protein] reductase
MVKKLEGKTALVTGGSRGIGRAIAELFLTEGARVAVNYNNGKKEAEELKKRFAGVSLFQADVSNFEAVRSMADEVHDDLGKIDILVNNAGIMYLSSWENYDEVMVNKMFKINQNGPINMIRAFLDDLKKRNGNVINIASNAGIGTSAENTTFYAMTKASVIMLTKRLAFDLRNFGVRVNAIAPGWINTNMTTGGKTDEEKRNIEEWFKKRSMLGKTGIPEDIAKGALFLASDDSSYMTGQIIVIDGGRMDNLTHSS